MKTIKSIRYLILSIPLAALLLGSCGKDWLEIDPVAMDTPDNLKQEPLDVMRLSLGTAYNSVTYSYPWGTSEWVNLNCASGDVNVGGGAAGDRIEYEQTQHLDLLTSESNAPQFIWERDFRGIRNVNQMLTDYSSFSSEKVDALKGESKILRSYFYFDMIRFFGDVPYFTEDSTYNAEGLRISADVVLDSLINTVKSNAHYLKRKSANGKFSYDAAHVLLAKMYMWKNDYINAAAALDTVILGGKYELMESYSDIFMYNKQFNNEVIFCTKPKNTGSNSSWANWESLYTIDIKLAGIRNFADKNKSPEGLVNGWGFLKPRRELVDAYVAAGDKVRLDANIWYADTALTEYAPYFTEGLFDRDSRTSTGGLTYSFDPYGYEGFFRKKYSNYLGLQRSNDWVDMSFIIYRYADVLLMRAECALNDADGDADALINEVRARVELDPITGATMADLKLERRLELAFEFDRYFDLVRWGDAAAVLTANNGYRPETNGLFPIPQSEIDLSNGVLTQNPGY
jgi:hypothetical protein